MSLSRRSFLATAGLLGLASCSRLERLRPDWQMPDIALGSSGTFSFAVVADPRLGDAASTAVLGRAVQAINADESLAFTVALGSLSQGGALNELGLAKQTLALLKRPSYAVPGARDANAVALDPWGNFIQQFDQVQWRREHSGWALLGLNAISARDGAGTIPQERLDWLDEQLGRVNKDRPVALFSYYSLAPGAPERATNADAVLERLAGHRLRLAVSAAGGDNAAEEANGVLFLNAACACNPKARNPAPAEVGYLVVRVEEEVIAHEFMALGAA